jgi:hypothetical protein
MLRNIRNINKEEVLHNFNYTANLIIVIKSRRKGLTRHVAQMLAMRSACKILVGRPDGKILLGKYMSKLKNYIQMDHRETGYEAVTS